MSGYSTIVGGTIVSPIRFNYDITVNTGGAISALLAAAGITDKVGLQFVIYNNGASPVGLTATSISNYLSYPRAATLTIFTLNANQSVTFITSSIGSTYEISASSAQFNIEGGAAGDLIYQTGASITDFVPAGTTGKILSNIVGVPSWQPFVPPNLKLSPAGSIDYQSAPSVTTTTGAGTAFSNTGGSIISNNSGITKWSDFVFGTGFSDSTYSTGSINLKAPRSYTVYASTMTASSGVIVNTWIRNNIGYVAGNSITIYNDKSTTFGLELTDYQNTSSYSSSFFNTATKTINLAPKETVELQQYNTTGLTINSTTQSQGWMAFGTNAADPWVESVDGQINFQTRTDPNGWFVSKNGGTNNAVQPDRPGYYMVTLTLSWQQRNDGISGYENDNSNIQIRKNNTQVSIFASSPVQSVSLSSMTFNTSAVVYLNGTTDYVNATAICGYNRFFFPTVFANGTNFSVVLLT